MSSWINFLLLYGIPILLILSGTAGIVRGQLGFGRDTAYRCKASVLRVVYICGGILLFCVLRILSRVQGVAQMGQTSISGRTSIMNPNEDGAWSFVCP